MIYAAKCPDSNVRASSAEQTELVDMVLHGARWLVPSREGLRMTFNGSVGGGLLPSPDRELTALPPKESSGGAEVVDADANGRGMA